MRIRTLTVSLLLFFAVNTAIAQQTKWTIDKSHSSISFEISHFVIATVKGNFEEFSGTLTSDGDDFTDGTVEVLIKTASVNTNQPDRDKDLRGPKFFNTEVHPDITFTSTSFKKKSDKEYILKGQLTVNGVTDEVELQGLHKGSFVHPRFKKTIGVFEFEATISRLKYKIGSMYPTAALGENIKLIVAVEMTKEE